MIRKSTPAGISQRDLIAKVGTAGVGAAALSGVGVEDTSAAQVGVPRWDREADVVVGSGAAGLPAAVRARELGVSVEG